MSARVTVFIPTWNAGPKLDTILTAVAQQQCSFEFEIRAIDSSSRDETQDILRRHGVSFSTISQAEFNHGETRNRAAADSESEFIAFLSQDALPEDRNWLSELVAPFSDDEIVGSYAAQVPEAGCHPFQRVNLAKHMDGSSAIQIREAFSAQEFNAMTPSERVARIRFDNVSSCIRREALLETRFPKTNFGEDLMWARTVLLLGKKLAFCPGARVIHSHDVNRLEFSNRVEDVHRILRSLCDFVPMPNRVIFFRRILSTMWRFLRVTWAASGIALTKRISATCVAPYYAAIQMAAMWRGSYDSTYDEPS